MTLYQRAAIALSIGLCALVAVLIAAVVALQSSWGQQQVARIAEQQSQRALDADISIGSIEGNLLRSPTIRDLSISRDGKPLVSAERVEVQYDASRLLRGDISIDGVTLFSPVIYLVEGPGGITLFDIFERDDSAARQQTRPFSIHDIRLVSGRIIIGPAVLDTDAVDVPNDLREVHGRLSLVRRAEGVHIAIAHFQFVGSNPHLVLQRLRGGIQYADGDLIVEQLDVRTTGSELVLDGAIANLATTEEAR